MLMCSEKVRKIQNNRSNQVTARFDLFVNSRYSPQSYSHDFQIMPAVLTRVKSLFGKRDSIS